MTRRDLLSGVDGLWELIEDHEQHCRYERLKVLVDGGSRGGRPVREDAILEIVRYDAHIRQLTMEKGGMDEQALDFLFGRPLVDTIKMFDIALVTQGGAYRLQSQPSFSKT